MSEPEDLEARVTELEGEIADLNTRVQRGERDAAAARVLAGGADRDVADLGAEVREFRGEFRDFQGEFRDFRDQNNQLHNATREDLTDLRVRMESGFARVDDNLGRVDGNFARVDGNLGRVDDNFLGIRGRLDAAAAGQRQIVELLTTLIDRRDDPRGP